MVERVTVGMEEPRFLSNVVLVPAGQSGQDYRMCVNLTEVNARTVASKRFIPDTQSVNDALHRSKFASTLDLKAGFHNVVIEPSSQQYAGFITQDGIYRFLRMPFGFLNAPAHFQSILEQVIHED